MKKTCLAVVFCLVLSLFNTFFLTNFVSSASAEQDYTTKTISEIGNPLMAGTGSYYDDGTLYYAHTGCTIGYNYEHGSTAFEFDLLFDNMAFPGWFSLTLKADGFDRTQSPNLTQKGYSFAIFPSGAVEVWKDGLSGVTGNMGAISTGIKYRVVIGAINRDEGVHLMLKVNGVDIISYTDTNNPYTEGNWFNICGDGGTVIAKLITTKQEVYPNYYTYTLSNIGSYPTIANIESAYVDRYNNMELYGSASTVGYMQYLKNFSLEMNVNFDTFPHGTSLNIAMRSSGLDRANSPNLAIKGYVIRIAYYNWGGSIAVTKNGADLGSVGYTFSEDTDYVLEIGTVDLDSSRTNVFVSVNNQTVLSVVDDNAPLQNYGWITFNNDGQVYCKMTSTNNKLTPLVTKVQETETSYVVETYFNNTISYTTMYHDNFSEALQKAISINSNSVYDINKAYYAIKGESRTNAVTLKYVDNKLVITIEKDWYLKSNDTNTTFEFEQLSLAKTTNSGGMVCPSGFVLKQTYYYNV